MKLMSHIYKFFTILIILSSVQVFADSATVVDGFQVNGLDMFKGKRISVYYVSARPATLETPGQIAKVRKVMKGPLTFSISQNGSVSIPEDLVPRDGWTNFNHVIFVIHGQAKHALRNVDGTYPDILDTENEVPVKTENADYLYRKSVIYDAATFSGSLKLF